MRSMQENLKTIVHEAIDEKAEASGAIITSLLDKRLGDMEKRLTEKMGSLDVQTADSTVHPQFIDASEEPVFVMSNQFCYELSHRHSGCWPHCFQVIESCSV